MVQRVQAHHPSFIFEIEEENITFFQKSFSTGSYP
jgi:hypothetical protein